MVVKSRTVETSTATAPQQRS